MDAIISLEFSNMAVIDTSKPSTFEVETDSFSKSKPNSNLKILRKYLFVLRFHFRI